MTSSTPSELVASTRIAALDGLRAIAALMVFVHHSELPGLLPLTRGLDAGVMVFFSLSGYLVYAPFAAARRNGRTVDWRAYAIRRLARIVPAYLIASVAISLLWYPDLLRNPVGLILGTSSPILIVWTLQLEIAYYALLPFGVRTLDRLGERARTQALLVVALCSLGFTGAVMAMAVGHVGWVSSAALSTLGSFLWAFVPGMIVAELEQQEALPDRRAPGLALGGVALILISVWLNPPPFLDITASVGSAMLVAAIVMRARRSLGARSRIATMAATAGALSYAVYLWHKPIVDAVDRPVTSWTGATLALGITVAIAAISYILVERPTILAGRRLIARIRARHRLAADVVVAPSVGIP